MENNKFGKSIIGMMFGCGMCEIMDAMRETLTEKELKDFEKLPLKEKDKVISRVAKRIEQKRKKQ